MLLIRPKEDKEIIFLNPSSATSTYTISLYPSMESWPERLISHLIFPFFPKPSIKSHTKENVLVSNTYSNMQGR